jgi:hypothetical protein
MYVKKRALLSQLCDNNARFSLIFFVKLQMQCCMFVLHLSELADRLPMAEHNSGQRRAGCVKRRQSWE